MSISVSAFLLAPWLRSFVLFDTTVVYPMLQFCVTLQSDVHVYSMFQFCLTLQWRISHVPVLCDITVTYILCSSSVWRYSDVYIPCSSSVWHYSDVYPMLHFCVTLQWRIAHVPVLCDVTVTYIPCCSSLWRYSDVYPMLQFCVTLKWRISHVTVLCDVTVTYIPCCSSVTLQWHISHVAVLCDVTVTYIPCCSTVWRYSDIYPMLQFCVMLQWRISHVAVLCDVTVTYIPCSSSVWRYKARRLCRRSAGRRAARAVRSPRTCATRTCVCTHSSRTSLCPYPSPQHRDSSLISVCRGFMPPE